MGNLGFHGSDGYPSSFRQLLLFFNFAMECGTSGGKHKTFYLVRWRIIKRHRPFDETDGPDCNPGDGVLVALEAQAERFNFVSSGRFGTGYDFFRCGSMANRRDVLDRYDPMGGFGFFTRTAFLLYAPWIFERSRLVVCPRFTNSGVQKNTPALKVSAFIFVFIPLDSLPGRERRELLYGIHPLWLVRGG